MPLRPLSWMRTFFQPPGVNNSSGRRPSSLPSYLIAQATDIPTAQAAPIDPIRVVHVLALDPLLSPREIAGFALVDAAQHGDWEFIAEAITQSLVNEVDPRHLGMALIAATEKRDSHIVSMLAVRGLLGKINENDQMEALNKAVELNCGFIAHSLLGSRAGVPGSLGILDTILSKAAEFHRLDIVNNLLWLHNDGEISSEGMGSALYKAIENNHLDIVESLITSSSRLFHSISEDNKRRCLDKADALNDPGLAQRLHLYW